MKLTKREKILLYFLGCFSLIMIGLFLLVFPTLDKKNDAMNELMASQNRLSKLESTIAQYGDLDNAIAEANSNIEQIEAKFYDPMPNEDVDALLKSKLLLHNMVPLSLNISVSQEQTLKAYGETAIKNTTGNIDANNAEATAPTVQLINVDMSFTGSTYNLSNLIDDINSMEATQVGSLSYDVENVDAPISISFKLYVR